MSKEPKRNVYVGHRYVPKIMDEWDKTISYEGLSIVTYKGASYTSKKRVPIGIDIENEEYWAVTGNYNSQIEHYRQDVKDLKDNYKKDLSEIKNDTNERFEDISIYVMPKPSNREENTNNLQYLLNKGGKNKNIKIKFRSGEYKLDTCFIKDSTEIELMDDTILICDGGESFSGSNHLFRNADENENTATNYNGNGNIHIHGGTIKNGHIISMIQAKNVIIENMNIIDMVTTHAVEIAGCKNVILRNLHFEGKLYSERGNDGKAEIIQIDLATYGNFPWLPEGSSSFNSIINENITIENCVFKPGKNSFKYHYSSIGSHSRNIENHKNIKITNCYFYNTTQSAIQLYTTDNVIIENNIFN